MPKVAGMVGTPVFGLNLIPSPVFVTEDFRNFNESFQAKADVRY
jgi:hypothetical protein